MRANDAAPHIGASPATVGAAAPASRAGTDPESRKLPAQTRNALAQSAYRAGIIGGGFMGRVHARAIRVAGGSLIGVVAGTAESSARAASEFDARDLEHSAQSLINSPDVDVIHICTPNTSHAEYALAALAAGKHVVCEKPLATTVCAATELTDALDVSGLVGTVPFVYRFHPMVREARERVSSGSIGRVHLVHGGYLQDWLLRASDNNWRVNQSHGGPSRAFADIGSHWCDLAEFVIGERFVGLSARAATVNNRRGGTRSQSSVSTEDIMTLQFQTTSGAIGTAVISQVSAGRKNRLLLEVSATEGTLTFDQEQPEQLWLGGREETRLLIRDPNTLSQSAQRYSRLPAGHAQGYQDCFDNFIADTADAIRGAKVDGLPTFTDGLRATRIADSVLTSVREQQWVEVPS